MGANKSSPKIASQTETYKMSERNDTPLIVSDHDKSPFQHLDLNENSFDSVESFVEISNNEKILPLLEIDLYNSYLFNHPHDFILTTNLLENRSFYTDFNRTQIVPIEALQNLFKDSFNAMIEYSEINKYLPSVVTIAIQIVIRICELKDLDLRTFSYLTAIAYKFSVQLEYSDSLFEEINHVVRIFRSSNLNKKLLIQMEIMILSLLKYDIIRDTIYLWLSIEQRQMLIDNKEMRRQYYNYISNLDIYLRSSQENADSFLNIF